MTSKRQFQALGLFGIDGEADALGFGELGQFQHSRLQFGHHPGAFVEFVARMQGRQLDRNRRRGEYIGIGAAGADGLDGVAVGLQIAVGVLLGQRAFAEHVEAVAVIGVIAAARAFQGLFDGAAHHELVAHDAHGLAHRQADGRFAHAADQAFEGADGIALGFTGQVDHAAGQHQAPG